MVPLIDSSSKTYVLLHMLNKANSIVSRTLEIMELQEFAKIEVVVRGVDGSYAFFKMPKSSQMVCLKEKYSQSVGIPLDRLRFLHQCKMVKDEDTPSGLGMGNGSQVWVMLEDN